jgi:hypothetical protein
MIARRNDGLLSEQVDNELLVFNHATDEGHALNEAAAIVFRLCEGNTDRETMAAQLSKNTGLPNDPIIVDLALAELHDAGLISLDQAPQGISRRSVVRQLGLTVMAAAMLPLIETMVARTAIGQTAPTSPLGPYPPTPGPAPKPSPKPKPTKPPHPPKPPTGKPGPSPKPAPGP